HRQLMTIRAQRIVLLSPHVLGGRGEIDRLAQGCGSGVVPYSRFLLVTQNYENPAILGPQGLRGLAFVLDGSQRRPGLQVPGTEGLVFAKSEQGRIIRSKLSPRNLGLVLQ